jgi:hypothetical protein
MQQIETALRASELSILALSPQPIEDAGEAEDASSLLCYVTFCVLADIPIGDVIGQEDLAKLQSCMSKSTYQPSNRWPFTKEAMCESIKINTTV